MHFIDKKFQTFCAATLKIVTFFKLIVSHYLMPLIFSFKSTVKLLSVLLNIFKHELLATPTSKISTFR